MKPGNEIIAHNVKLLREIEGGTMDEFGKKYGSNQKALWTYEAGNAKPKPDFLLRLSRGVRIPPETLLSVKLKKDRAGTIINLPSKTQKIREFRNDLKKLIADYRKANDTFFSGLELLNERLDAIENLNKTTRKFI